ncbi:MAG: hypothetical protein ICV84_18230 [Flavisolibacter sp.]|nr:hypothetical protein [Flavisolibacter sp.]
MKNVLLSLLLVTGLIAKGQTFNNEWIDYSKTYYKFKVGRTGLYRISGATLAASGLSSVQGQFVQLWRNGKQVPVYASATGTLSATDYVEFWGEMNDGKPDKEMYRHPDYQLNDKWSLQTDSSVYFLTMNSSGSNFQATATVNNVAGNTLPAEPYFMCTVGRYFRDKINNGYAVNVGEYLYSSAYDKGEGWTSNDISSGATNSFSFDNLYVYTTGPGPIFRIAVSGNAVQPRSYRVKINSDSVFGKNVDYFNHAKDTFSFPLSLISSNTANVQVTNIGTEPNDRMVIHQYEMTYPRQFNFGGASNFEFSLPASSTGNYLQISGFSYGSTPPILYDLTNGKRYVADISNPSFVRVVLQPSASPRNLVLVNAEAANINTISSLQQRTFTNITDAANQGNYIIISNSILFNGANGTNPVDEYRAYRSSAAGGGYTAKVYDIDELTDQFAFGIKKHPLAIRDFLRFARNRFTTAPKFVFLIGHAVHYVSQRYGETNPDMYRLNLVPTFGWPASDVLLSADPGDAIPKTPIGRLSAINAQEVAVYLKKIKEYEAAQQTASPSVADKAWMKNVVHVVGASDPVLQSILDNYMNTYKRTITDTLFGAHVTTFTKTSSNAVQQISGNLMENLFKEGISLITYFGHSSSGTLEFNLNNPDQYNNQGKYPMFFALGCNAGNFFEFNTTRFSAKETLSEKFVLAPDRGTIGFVASSHFGIVHYLDIYCSRAYKSIAIEDYGQSVGEILKNTIIKSFAFTTQEDFYSRAQNEETILHGDPAIRLNTHAKPDYAITEPQVRLSPSIISVADASFKVNAQFLNIGKAVNENIVVQITRTYPNQTTEIIRRDTIQGIRYVDSVSVNVPIDPARDKGTNKITVTIDADNAVDELFENNNTITKEFIIYEDEARPVYPYDFSIVNRQNIKLMASTANPFSASRTYRMELDTTELFNSPLKVSSSTISGGGILEFAPNITFSDSTVYYWRIAMIPPSGELKWRTASFIYMNNSDTGFNQSHLYQHLKSEMERMYLDSVSHQWIYADQKHNLFARSGVFPTAANQSIDISISVDGDPYVRSVCGLPNIIVSVFDPVKFKPWLNALPGQPPQYGSDDVCGTNRIYNFQYSIMDPAKRKSLVEFLELIPTGHIVVVRNTSGTDDNNNYFADKWKSDTSFLGSNRSIYHYLYNQGFYEADSFNRSRAFIFIYKKDMAASFTPKYTFSEGIYDKITLSVDVNTPDTLGFITSPVLGPAQQWKELKWRGKSAESPGTDKVHIDVVGIRQNGSEAVLFYEVQPTQQDFDLSGVDVHEFPYIKLRMHNQDSVKVTPYQLQYWRVTYTPAPEGALAPNLYLNMKDTLALSEPLDFKVAFKNISDMPFDSLKVKMVVTDQNNVQHVLPVQKHRPLNASDTLHVHYNLDTRPLSGHNNLYIEVNPDNDQPEQYHFNNIGMRNFYVAADYKAPLMDVTFDNVHILNYDIVSSRPEILIQLKDEDKWGKLDDTSLVTVQIRYPNGTVRRVAYNSDTLQFIPAQSTASENTATVHYKPYFDQDGIYELIVSGKDKSNNLAGAMEYRVSFEVVNKAMISNMLNYPNPFTTSTAFVFTITGAQVPQNLKIQILTVTGKIVREITKEELGPLHIGRNITQFKWDGTDQYGQKLANGVYLYRVIAENNGKSLEKYKAQNDDTDKYFNKGYGKMYLMR